METDATCSCNMAAGTLWNISSNNVHIVSPPGIKVERGVPMKQHTSFKIGGPADYFARPSSVNELIQLLQSARDSGIPSVIMGSGTNILVKDRGIRGLVISLVKMREEIEIESLNSEYAVVSASAGTILAALCRKTISHGLEDLSFAAGIPGTVGGAVMMNAGTGAGNISDQLISIDILDRHNNVITLERSQLLFSHRRVEFLRFPSDSGIGSDSRCDHLVSSSDTPLSLKDNNVLSLKDNNGCRPVINGFRPVIVSASFLLKRGSREKLERSWHSLMERRRASQPHGIPSAGCFFKNPDTGKSAGELIDMAGLKTRRVGDAMVSDKHANFILNLGSATAREVVTLQHIVKETVFEKFAVSLSEEVIIQGE